MSHSELQRFLAAWDREAQGTIRLLRALPVAQYDFRPDPQGRSLGELAWHLAEIDAYITHLIATGVATLETRPPNIERPRTVENLAPGYQRIHDEAVERVASLRPEDLDRRLPFFDGTQMTVREMLWAALLHHLIHHRGELVLMCRLAGGVPPGLYGPTREETEAIRSSH